MGAVADSDTRPIAAMDPPGNAYEIYKREVGRDAGLLALSWGGCAVVVAGVDR